MSYDTHCYELAEFFLEDEPAAQGPLFQAHAHVLAQLIQDTIEDHIRFTLRQPGKHELGTLVEFVDRARARTKSGQIKD